MSENLSWRVTEIVVIYSDNFKYDLMYKLNLYMSTYSICFKSIYILAKNFEVA